MKRGYLGHVKGETDTSLKFQLHEFITDKDNLSNVFNSKANGNNKLNNEP